ncbi:unnamed protein product, partial [Amoebophrya sp. A25]|eukprot:GSA25T00026035001.1
MPLPLQPSPFSALECAISSVLDRWDFAGGPPDEKTEKKAEDSLEDDELLSEGAADALMENHLQFADALREIADEEDPSALASSSGCEDPACDSENLFSCEDQADDDEREQLFPKSAMNSGKDDSEGVDDGPHASCSSTSSLVSSPLAASNDGDAGLDNFRVASSSDSRKDHDEEQLLHDYEDNINEWEQAAVEDNDQSTLQPQLLRGGPAFLFSTHEEGATSVSSFGGRQHDLPDVDGEYEVVPKPNDYRGTSCRSSTTTSTTRGRTIYDGAGEGDKVVGGVLDVDSICKKAERIYSEAMKIGEDVDDVEAEWSDIGLVPEVGEAARGASSSSSTARRDFYPKRLNAAAALSGTSQRTFLFGPAESKQEERHRPVFSLKDLRDHPDWASEPAAFSLDLVQEDLEKIQKQARLKFAEYDQQRVVLKDELRLVGDELAAGYRASATRIRMGIDAEINETSAVARFLRCILNNGPLGPPEEQSIYYLGPNSLGLAEDDTSAARLNDFTPPEEPVAELPKEARNAALSLASRVHDYWKALSEKLRVLSLMQSVSDNLLETEKELAVATVDQSDLQIVLHSEELHSYPASVYEDPHKLGKKTGGSNKQYQELLETKANLSGGNLAFRRSEFLKAADKRERYKKKLSLLGESESDLGDLLQYVSSNAPREPSLLYKPFDPTSDVENFLERYMYEADRARAAHELRLMRHKADLLQRILEVQDSMRRESTSQLCAVTESLKTVKELVMTNRDIKFVDGGGTYTRTLLKDVDQGNVQGIRLVGGAMQGGMGRVAQFEDPSTNMAVRAGGKSADYTAGSVFYDPYTRYDKRMGRKLPHAIQPTVRFGHAMPPTSIGNSLRHLNTVSAVRRKVEMDTLLDRFYDNRLRERKRTGLLSEIEIHIDVCLTELSQLEEVYNRLALKIDMVEEEVYRLEVGNSAERSATERKYL